MTTNSPHTPWTRRPLGMALLVVSVVVLFGLVLFVRQTLKYYSDVRSGIPVELTNYAQQATLSELEGQIGPETIDNTRVNNYADDPFVGPADAAVTVVMFEDFQCPFCGQLQPDLHAAMAKYKNSVKFVYRDFPLDSIHPNARKAAEAAQCAHDQGRFWEYHDVLFANPNAQSENDLKAYADQLGLNTLSFTTCVDNGIYADEVEADFQDGVAAGVLGTPTLFFNGNKVDGVISLEGFDHILAYFLK